MASKWEEFKKDFNQGYAGSSLDVRTVNIGPSNILEDWVRVVEAPVLINGVPIQTLLQEDRGSTKPLNRNEFKNKKELADFFAKHLLKNIKADDEEKKLMLEQMMKFLHQGALLMPVSAAAAMAIANKTEGKITPANAKEVVDAEGRIVKDSQGKLVLGAVVVLNFNATTTGFIVNEQRTQNIMVHNADDGIQLIHPDNLADKPYIYKAEAEISVDFSKNPSAPQIKVEKNIIDFGNKKIENLLDGRSFLQKFIDGLLLALGYRTIDKVAKIVESKKKSNAVKGDKQSANIEDVRPSAPRP